MPILYNKMNRNRPGESGGKKQWYPVAKSTKLAKEKKVAELLAEKTLFNEKQVEITVSQLFEVITELLLNGWTVQLGKLGFFSITLKTKPSDSAEEVNASKIKKATVRFTESNRLKNIIKKAIFVAISPLTKTTK